MPKTAYTLMAAIHNHSHGSDCKLFLIQHDPDEYGLPGFGNEVEVVDAIGINYEDGEELVFSAVGNVPPKTDMKLFVEMGLPVINETDYSDTDADAISPETEKFFRSLIDNIGGGQEEPVTLGLADENAEDDDLMKHIEIADVEAVRKEIKGLLERHRKSRPLSDFID